MINPVWNTRIRWFALGFLVGLVPMYFVARWEFHKALEIANNDQKTITELKKQNTSLVESTKEPLSAVTVLTESRTAAQPMSLFGGLLTVEPTFAGSQAVPVWIVPLKVKPRVLAVAGPNHVYYWASISETKIEGPFTPAVQPQ